MVQELQKNIQTQMTLFLGFYVNNPNIYRKLKVDNGIHPYIS